MKAKPATITVQELNNASAVLCEASAMLDVLMSAEGDQLKAGTLTSYCITCDGLIQKARGIINGGDHAG